MLLLSEEDAQAGWGEVAWHVILVTPPNLTRGTYTVVLTDITDLEDESELGGQATTGVVSVGGSVTGTLDVDGDVDWFRVTLEAGKTYRIKVRGADSRVETCLIHTCV